MRRVASAGLIATSFQTLPSFALTRARTTEEAVDALADSIAPCVYAGGTDWPARFNEGACPDRLVDIARIDALQRVERTDDALVIGAAVTHWEGARHPLVRALAPGFGEAWSRIANIRVRFAATLGGNLMARRARYEGSLLLTALGARLCFAGPEGALTYAVEDVWAKPPSPSALLTAISIPLRRGLRLDYERSMRPTFTQAIAIDAAGEGRIVAATEHAWPQVRLAAAASVAPGPFQDPVTSDAYLQRLSLTFAQRQLARLEAA